MKTSTLSLLLACALLLSACGNKGPLTLPPPAKASAADHTAPAAPR